MVYLGAESVFILEHYFASKSFAAVREVFRSVYPDKEIPNETTVCTDCWQDVGTQIVFVSDKS
jgi:hypothetical protein